MKRALVQIAAPLLFWPAASAQAGIDPTWLHRSLDAVHETMTNMTSIPCMYKPIFGTGNADAPTLKSISRFGDVEVYNGSCAEAAYAGEEEVYIVLAGKGLLTCGNTPLPVHTGDYVYVPPGQRCALSTGTVVRAVMAGFQVQANMPGEPRRVSIANIDDVPLRSSPRPPSSTQYRFMIGGVGSNIHRLATGLTITDVSLLEIPPGGSDFPHHYEDQEQIYLLLDGRGEVVAGGGMDGIEGRHAAAKGDAFFFRLNCTLGFYNTYTVNARVLAVRSRFPFKCP